MAGKGFGKNSTTGGKLNFPWYFDIDGHLVKVIGTPTGGVDVLVFNANNGKLERNLDYLTRCFEPGQAVKRLTEEEFNTRQQQR